MNDKELAELFWERVDEKRRGLHKSWNELARDLGIKETNIRGARARSTLPRVETLVRYSQILSCSVNDLLS